MAWAIAIAAAAVTAVAGSAPTAAARHLADPPALAIRHLTDTQLAGQRVIFSYSGLTPPPSLLQAIRRGEAAGVIFFAGNISSPAQLAAVAQELQQAAADRRDPVRAPLLLMTDQEGGAVRGSRGRRTSRRSRSARRPTRRPRPAWQARVPQPPCSRPG